MQTQWQAATEDHFFDGNVIALKKYLDSIGISVEIAKVEGEIYPKILDKVREASNQKWEIDPSGKKILKERFMPWLKKVAQESVSGDTLRYKMQQKANIPEDYVITALDERMLYRQNTLNAGYLDLSNWEHISGEILSELAHLRLRLDTGEENEGISFYKLCQDKLIDLWEKNNQKIPLYIFNGYMHEITDRCGHRYHKEGTR